VRSGKKDALALAQERMDVILATHKPTPLTAEHEQAMEDILQEARQVYRERATISDAEWSAYMATLASGN
jgi:DNA-binding IclR family transcriptional regulator